MTLEHDSRGRQAHSPCRKSSRPQCRKHRLAAHSLCLENREKPSRWGQLAREGHRVVQFRDVRTLFSSRAFSLWMTLQLQLVKERLLN
jgi:hypothetical protein